MRCECKSKRKPDKHQSLSLTHTVKNSVHTTKSLLEFSCSTNNNRSILNEIKSASRRYTRDVNFSYHYKPIMIETEKKISIIESDRHTKKFSRPLEVDSTQNHSENLHSPVLLQLEMYLKVRTQPIHK